MQIGSMISRLPIFPLEMIRHLSYTYPDARLYHWRSAGGAEVDLIVARDDEVYAVEVKSSKQVRAGALRGVAFFREEHPHARIVCACTAESPYFMGDVPVLPWHHLFHEEWLG